MKKSSSGVLRMSVLPYMFHGIESKILKWLRQSSIQDARAPEEFKCLPVSRTHVL